MLDYIGQVIQALGARADAASTSGSANAKLASLVPLVSGTVNAALTYPDGAAGAIAVSNALGWTYGSYTTIVSSGTLAAHMITALAVDPSGCSLGTREFEFQIGTGSSGSETVIGTYPYMPFQASAVGMQFGEPQPFPHELQIPANARVAYRCRDNAGGQQLDFYFVFEPRPR